MKNYNLLQNLEFIKWCYEWITTKTLVNCSNAKILKPFADEENIWWNSIIWQENNNQWTTLLCQEAVREMLEKLWYKPFDKSRSLLATKRNKKYQPDLETEDAVWEVKWRNWTTTGTAWEKILWTPLKYAEIPTIYNKPLNIILVWYQEFEARNSFACWDLVNKKWIRTQELNEFLNFFENKNIKYIWFTDLLRKIWLNYWCWDIK